MSKSPMLLPLLAGWALMRPGRALRVGASSMAAAPLAEAPEALRGLLAAGVASPPVHGAYAHELHFDGGCRGNPGCGGCGAIVTDANSGATLWAGWCFLPEASTTNNVAEYAALVLGCEGLKALGLASCGLVGDSKLVVNQVNGDWRCRDARLSALRDRALGLLDGVDFAIAHVPRAANGHADALANHAMDTRSSGAVVSRRAM